MVLKRKDKDMEDYTLRELEELVKQSRCFQDSIAFQSALFFIGISNKVKYKELLYRECKACGAI